MLLRCGAAKVYGIEATGLADFTAALATANGFAERYQVIRGKSTEVELPERVDLVVSDQLGAFAVEGRPFTTLADAAARHLAPGGRLVPAAIELWSAPVASARVRDHLGFWTMPRLGLDVTPLRDIAVGSPLYQRLDDAELAAAPALLARLDTHEVRASLDLGARFTVNRDCRVNALAGWFRAELAADVWISTAPAAADRIDREGILMPLDPALACSVGDELRVRFRALLESTLTVWEAERDGEPLRRHSSWQSYTAAPIPGA